MFLWCIMYLFNYYYLSSSYLLLLQSALQPLWVWASSAGRFLQSAVASGTSNPQLGGPVIRTFQLPPPGVPTSETTRANPSSGRWNYGREIAENFAESGDFHVTFGFFYMPQINC